MNDDMGQFLFLAAGAVGLFAYLSVAHWVNARTEDRRDRDRMVLLRRLAEQAPDGARSVLDHLREEEARAREKERKKELQTRRNGMQAGAVMIAVGIGLSITFAFLTRRGVVLGLVPALVGVVVFAFAALDKPAASSPTLPSERTDRPTSESWRS